MRRTWENMALAGAATLLICSLGAKQWIVHRQRVAAADRQVALVAGDTVPDMTLELGDTSGVRKPTMAIFFTAECPWCKVSVPRWNMLADTAVAHGFVVHAVSLSDSASTSEMARRTGFQLSPTIAAAPRSAIVRWRVVRVPYTVLLTADHHVAASWVGLVDSTVASEILNYLH